MPIEGRTAIIGSDDRAVPVFSGRSGSASGRLSGGVGRGCAIQRRPFREAAAEQPRQLVRLPQLLGAQERHRLRHVDGSPAHLVRGQAVQRPVDRWREPRHGALQRQRLSQPPRDAAPARHADHVRGHVLGFGEDGQVGRCRVDAEPLIHAAHHARRIGDQPLVDQHRDAVAAEPLQERPQLHRVVADRDELRVAPDRFGDRPVFGMVPHHVPVMADRALDRVAEKVDEAGLGVEGGDPFRHPRHQRQLGVVGAGLAQDRRVAGRLEQLQIALLAPPQPALPHLRIDRLEMPRVDEVARLVGLAHVDVRMRIQQLAQIGGAGLHGADQEQIRLALRHRLAAPGRGVMCAPPANTKQRKPPARRTGRRRPAHSWKTAK